MNTSTLANMYNPIRIAASNVTKLRGLFRPRVMRPIITTAVIKTANIAVMVWTDETADQMGWPTSDMSSMDRMKPMLNRLLPKTPDMASSGALMRMAANEAASSGNEVLKARNYVPTKLASHPINSVRLSPICANHIAAATTIIAAPPNRAKVLARL